MSNPTVAINDTMVLLGDQVSGVNLFSATDPDGDPITKYRLLDTYAGPDSGFFTVGGVIRAANIWFEITANQLNSLVYNSGSEVSKELIRVQAFDGTSWSDISSAWVYSVLANTTKPNIITIPVQVVAFETIQAIDYVAGQDPDGWPILKYMLRDRKVAKNSGYFTIDGVAQAENSWFEIDAADLSKVAYVGAITGQTENIDIKAFDGVDWSDVKTVLATTLANLNRPVVSPATHTLPEDFSVPLDSLFSWTDADGNTAKAYRFYDTSPGAGSGNIALEGVALPALTWVEVSAADLEKMTYNTGQTPGQEAFRVRVFDGKHWSEIATINIKAIIRPDLGVAPTQVLSDLESLDVTDLYTKLDFGPGFSQFQVYDATVSLQGELDLSGGLRLNGNPLDARQVYTLSPVQMTDLTFVGAVYNSRQHDDIYVRANNGTFWSPWERASIRTEPNYIAALSPSNTASDAPSWLDFGVTTLTYSFAVNYPTDGRDVGDVAQEDFVTMSEQARNAIREQFARIDPMFPGITFVEVSDGAAPHGIIRIHGYFDDEITAPAAFAFFPNDLEENPEGGDIWFNFAQVPYTSWPDGGGARAVFDHELGHALGLSHSFFNQIPYEPKLPLETENSSYTVMSYSGRADGLNARVYNMYDIAALQVRYGDGSVRAGNTLYDIPGYWKGTSAWNETINDSSGIDTFDFSASIFPDIIDLRPGGYSRVGNPAQRSGPNIAIDFTTFIENGIGGSGNNQIIGNEVANILRGNDGDDDITSRGGDDLMFAGRGNDIYRWAFGDHSDTIDEETLAGRDRLEIGNFTDFGLDDFKEDLTFTKLGTDLRIDLRIDGQPAEGGVLIKNQKWGGSRIETLHILGVDVDLTDVYAKTASPNQKFTIDFISAPSTFGYLVAVA
jgi:hypothetical protein